MLPLIIEIVSNPKDTIILFLFLELSIRFYSTVLANSSMLLGPGCEKDTPSFQDRLLLAQELIEADYYDGYAKLYKARAITRTGGVSPNVLSLDRMEATFMSGTDSGIRYDLREIRPNRWPMWRGDGWNERTELAVDRRWRRHSKFVALPVKLDLSKAEKRLRIARENRPDAGILWAGLSHGPNQKEAHYCIKFEGTGGELDCIGAFTGNVFKGSQAELWPETMNFFQ